METSTIPAHCYHGIPIGGRIGDGVILSAERLWASFRAEAEDLLRIDGRWIAGDRQRNRRIEPVRAMSCQGWDHGHILEGSPCQALGSG